MKFTKEEACKKLAEKFSPKVEKIDKWDRTIRENVENLFSLLGDESEIELDSFIETAVSMLTTTAGFLRKENSELAKSYESKIEELKKSHNSEKEKGEDIEKTALEERLKLIEDELILAKKEKNIKDIKSKLTNAIKEKGVDNQDWIDIVLSKASITEDMDVEKEAESYVDMFNKIASTTPKTVTPRNSGGSPSNDTNKLLSEVKNIIKNQIS